MLSTKIKKGGYKVIDYNGCLYLFIIKTGALFQIDDKLKEALENDPEYFDSSFLNPEDAEMTVEELKKVGMFELAEASVGETCRYDEKQANNLILMLSQSCNLNCTYCYADGGEYNNKGFMDQETASKAIDFIFSQSEKDEININLFGGEPLLNFQLFKFCVEYSRKKADEANKKVSFSTTTNGTLIDNETAAVLSQNKFSVTLSIDGDELTHDRNRFYANGGGTYKDIVTKTIEHLGMRNITARATLTDSNTKIDEIYDHLYSLGFGNIHITPSVNMLSEQGFRQLALSYKIMVKKFKDAVEKRNYKYCKKMSNVMSMLIRFYNGGSREKFCGAANNMIAVDIDGAIFACHRLVNNVDSKYGTIHDGYDMQFRDRILGEMLQTTKNSECGGCWCKTLCGGGCPSENLITNEDMKIPNKYSCDLFKNNAEEFLRLYIDLTDEQKELLLEKKAGGVR